ASASRTDAEAMRRRMDNLLATQFRRRLARGPARSSASLAKAPIDGGNREMRFFFYGTLLDADLRRVLCGPAADRWTIASATLADHRRGRSPGRTYPFLLPAPGESVDGIVADGVDATAAAVMTLYEGLG